MRTSEMSIRPEGMYYYTLLNHLAKSHPMYDEIEARALHYAKGFIKEHDILSILENHPNRRSIANFIMTEGGQEMRFDHLLLFEGSAVVLDVCYAEEGINVLEDGEVIRWMDGSSIGNPLQAVKAKAAAFEKLASERGWLLPPVKSLVLFVHSEAVFAKDTVLPDGYVGELDMVKEIIAGIETEGESHEQESLQETEDDMVKYVAERHARCPVWRDEACADIVSNMVMGEIDQSDPLSAWYQNVLDYYILKGDVLDADEAELMMGLFNFSQEQEDGIRRLLKDLPKNPAGDYLLSYSIRFIWGLDTHMEELSKCIANRVYEDLLA
ncbi:nuclease-related domain-containing protein [Salisediminibacterium selenitireducens]|uniref:NERD domain-containing protein n=1 Tax=Bacillus selenitireducens (strain ATCC 700615 / DSM 15326 / MLS10) TaxID=439292 RepID=D6Y0F1_BACIE|nr:nuclease-related domain-containing protein [Salisediminibacterium selenitireducens]ADH98542.1 hypothetical protein Bsel_1022 [[Bacillus] selenitireducens MLS10]